jgi:hypothetical protein
MGATHRSYRGLSGEVVTMLSVIDRPFRAPELKQRPQPAEAGGSKSHACRPREGCSCRAPAPTVGLTGWLGAVVFAHHFSE